MSDSIQELKNMADEECTCNEEQKSGKMYQRCKSCIAEYKYNLLIDQAEDALDSIAYSSCYKENNKFTAIYSDSWVSGGRMVSSTQMRRIEQKDGETVVDMLKREGIDRNTLFLFQGHPLLQGEELVTTDPADNL